MNAIFHRSVKITTLQYPLTANGSSSKIIELKSIKKTCDILIICPRKICLRGKYKLFWTSINKTNNTTAAARKFLHIYQEPTNSARNWYTPYESFSKFFAKSILKMNLLHTNLQIEIRHSLYSNTQLATVPKLFIEVLRFFWKITSFQIQIYSVFQK